MASLPPSAAGSNRIIVEGLDELRATMRRLGGPTFVRALGPAHKRIGEMVIARAGGADTHIGEGRGQRIRPSATTREVQLRVGGAFRARFTGHWRQWGITQVFPPPIPRPYLIGAAVETEDEIYDAYLDAVNEVTRPVLEVERG